ncbi:MAG: glycosyltransferase [Proteobacteria bacterium]|nr:glycosyltransferase [Pseudomonadota bacterium]
MKQKMKADLHVHSKFSVRPSYWILQKLGCSESYVEPINIYELAKQKGMDYITISDHNTIAGSLEIAHLPDTFISEEVTTYFPDNGCKIHVLTLDITEAQHENISKIRKNIFDLSHYLKKESITHVVAHPLFAINDRLTADHFEKLLLLFNNFELNGTRDSFQNTILMNILNQLSEKDIDTLANKHNIEPFGPLPWQKNLTGGSDDHSGFHIARTYTVVEEARNVKDFLSAIDQHKSRACGEPYHPRMMAHTLYAIAYQFYNKKFKLNRFKKKDPFLSFIDHVLNTPANQKRPLPPFNQKRKGRDWETEFNESRNLSTFCLQTAREVLNRFPEFKQIINGETITTEEKISLCYNFVDQTSDEILARLCNTMMEKFCRGNLFDVFQMIGAGGALYSMLSPYFIAYKVFTKDRLFVKTIENRMQGVSTEDKRLKVGHFTDTLHDINGVAKTLKKQSQIASQLGKEMILITCGPGEYHPSFKTFEPIGSFEIPEYSELKVHYPPILKMIDYCYQTEINRIHIATPGPVGVAALCIARILKLPVYGTYHTAFPQYVKEITGDTGLEDLTWRYMRWFYNQMDRVFVPSKATGDELIERGISKEKIRLYARGIDTLLFNPVKRNGFFKSRYKMPNTEIKLLYVGRVAKEKNLDILIELMKRISMSHANVHLVVVGGGPYLKEMKIRSIGLPIIFTGYMEGDELSEAYASSDIFVFPSTSDTFGNVVLEAQASGIPVIVTDQGGPSENLIPDVTGYVVPAGDVNMFVEKIEWLINHPEHLATMKKQARTYMASRSFESAFLKQWNMYHEPMPAINSSQTPFFYN